MSGTVEYFGSGNPTNDHVGVGYYGYSTPEMDRQTYENYTGVTASDIIHRIENYVGDAVRYGVFGAAGGAFNKSFTATGVAGVGVAALAGGVSGVAWGLYTGYQADQIDVMKDLASGKYQ